MDENKATAHGEHNTRYIEIMDSNNFHSQGSDIKIEVMHLYSSHSLTNEFDAVIRSGIARDKEKYCLVSKLPEDCFI